ncbi:MAG: GIN domain-containing protein [Bacteroidales bacterium]
MKKTILLAITIVLSICTLYAKNDEKIKGSGVNTSKEIKLSAFNQIEINAPIELEVIYGYTHQITLSGDEKFLSLITVDVENNKLTIKTSRKNINFEDVHATVTMPGAVKLLALTGFNSAQLNVPTDENQFTGSVTGMGNVKISKAKSKQITINVAGMASVEVEGEAKNVSISNSGMGLVNFEHVMAEKVECNNAGVGLIIVNATESLVANVGGIGGVVYGGNPKKVVKNIGGLGTVKPMDKK